MSGKPVYMPERVYPWFKRVAWRWVWAATFNGRVARVELRRAAPETTR